MGLETLAIGSLLLGAVGAGVSYTAQQNSAAAQEQFALLNSQAQQAQASMQARLATAQAAIQAQESANQQTAATVNANALKLEAEQKARESQINIARQMEEQAAFQSMMRARGGASGTTGSGSQLDLLARSAELQVLENAESQYQTVQQRRQLFREAQGYELGGDLAGIQRGFDIMGGEAAASAYRARGIQAEIQGLAGVSAARGASLSALGGLIGNVSGLGLQAYNLNRLGALRWGGSSAASPAGNSSSFI